MKANELMIGDFCRCGEILVKITRISENSASGLDLSALSPIPLTAEILEKNIFPFAFGCCRSYENHRDGFYIETPDGTCIYGLSYVHELQHALRLCGLNELADNLKLA